MIMSGSMPLPEHKEEKMRSTGRIFEGIDFTDIPDYGLTWRKVASKYGVEGIRSLAVFNNKIYAGTDTSGNLLEWSGTEWVSKAGTFGAGYGEWAILSLVVLDGNLYGTTWGTGLLLKWNGTDAWVQVAAQIGSEDCLECSIVLNGEIYAGGSLGQLYKWNGTDSWVQVAEGLGSDYINTLTVFNGKIYGGTYHAKLYEYSGTDTWVQVAGQADSETFIVAMAVLNEELYSNTGPHGRLYKWNGTDAWVMVADQLGSVDYITALAILDGEIYGTGSAGALLYKWNGTDSWVLVSDKIGGDYDTVTAEGLLVKDGVLYAGIETGTNAGALLEAYTRFADLGDRSRYGNTGIATDTALDKLESGICSIVFEKPGSRIVISKNKSINNLRKQTISFWLYITGVGLIDSGYIYDKNFRIIRIVNGTQLQIIQYFGAGFNLWRTSADSLLMGVWQHVCIIYDATDTDNDPEVCLNGVKVTVTKVYSSAGEPADDSGYDLVIGDSNVTQYYLDGRLAMLRMWNRLKTEPQALAEFNSTRHWFGI